MLKVDARNLLSQKRQQLSGTDCVKWDDLILIQLQKLDWSHTHCIGNYYPIEKHNEPNSLLLAKYLNYIIPDLIITYPVVNKILGTMDFFTASDEMTTNEWGIAEPLAEKQIAHDQIDAFLVPLLGFDVLGHRVGFGKGYYDKYFENCKHPHKRIGISYFDPIPNIQDTHEFDVPLTHCITPWNSYEF